MDDIKLHYLQHHIIRNNMFPIYQIKQMLFSPLSYKNINCMNWSVMKIYPIS